MATRTRRAKSAPETPAVERQELPEPKHRYVVFSEWLETEKGYVGLDPATLQVALANYGAFQRSDVNRGLNAERKAAREAATAERSSTTKRSTKSARTTKTATAAAESAPAAKPTKRAAKGSATKTTGRRGRKAAAETASAPY